MERIKNLFEVEGIFFVLAIDKEQLYSVVEHTFGVKKVGERDNRAIYLQKFINMDYELPEPSLVDFASLLLEKVPKVNISASFAMFTTPYSDNCSRAYSDMIYLFKNSGYNSLRDFEYFIQKLYIVILNFKNISFIEILISWATLLDNTEIRTLYNELETLKFTIAYYNNDYNFIDNLIMNVNLILLGKESINSIDNSKLSFIQQECKRLSVVYSQYLIHYGEKQNLFIDEIANPKWLKQRFANYLTLVNME